MKYILALLALFAAMPADAGTLKISQSNVTLQGLRISNASGPCIQVDSGVTGVVIKENNIGPCGTNNSTSQSAGIFVTGNSSVDIYDNYIHVENAASVCSPSSHDGIEVLDNTGTVRIKGNVILATQRGILTYNASNLTIDGNYVLNPQGPGCNPGNGGNFIQVYADTGSAQSNATITNNYGQAVSGQSAMEDGISVGGNFTNWTATGNYVLGGNSNSGCGITADSGAFDGTISDNIIRYYNCAIQITNGANTANNNKALCDLGGGVNGACLVTSENGIPGNACGPTTITNSIYAGVTLTNGSWYNDGTCDAMTQSGNTVDSGCTNGVNCTGYAALSPITSTNPPPLIPPVPVNCVARSPYSTQTSSALCAR